LFTFLHLCLSFFLFVYFSSLYRRRLLETLRWRGSQTSGETGKKTFCSFSPTVFGNRTLVLRDGRQGLRRVLFVGLYCFYKSALLALSQALFANLSLFSGASLFSSSQLLLYNLLFTSAPLLSRLADRDPNLSFPVRWNAALPLWLVRAALQAALLFLVAVFSCGDDCELNLLSFPAYCASVLVVTGTLLLEANTWTWYLFAAVIVPPLLLFVSVICLSALPFTREYGMSVGWAQVAAVLLGSLVSLLPVFLFRAARAMRESLAARHHYAKLSDNEEL
jgi:magnesium-transporting ATPase (P-type)